MKDLRRYWLACVIISLVSMASAQETGKLPSKLQLAVEPEEITLTKGLTVGSPQKKIHL